MIMKRHGPFALTGEIMLNPKQAPVVLTTGVMPFSPHVVPAGASERTPDWSAKKMAAPSRCLS